MDALTAAQFTERQRKRLADEGVALPDGSFPIRNKTDLSNAIQSIGRAKDPAAAKRHIEKRARALGAKDMLPEDWVNENAQTAAAAVASIHVDEVVLRPHVTYSVKVNDGEPITGMVIGDPIGEAVTASSLQEQENESMEEDNERYSEQLCPSCGVTGAAGEDGMCAACGAPRNMTASAAGYAPLKPPAEWFYMEEPDEPTPLTVTADGRIFGHAALWGSCHTGFPGRCTQPPPSPSGYSFFHLGQVETEEGEMVDVGRITIGTGHASLTASREQAAAHYDNTGMVAGYVRAKDGEHGIWVCGAARSDAPAEKVAALRGAAVSGDWRRTSPGSPMEMIGLLAVNVPGFPVPRPQAALAASALGETIDALVAAGINTTTEEQAEAQLDVLLQLHDGSIDQRIYTPTELLMGQTAAAIPAPVRYSDEEMAEQELDALLAAGWDESKHPRAPKGSKGGGRFVVSTSAGTFIVDAEDEGDAASTVISKAIEGEIPASPTQISSMEQGNLAVTEVPLIGNEVLGEGGAGFVGDRLSDRLSGDYSSLTDEELKSRHDMLYNLSKSADPRLASDYLAEQAKILGEYDKRGISHSPWAESDMEREMRIASRRNSELENSISDLESRLGELTEAEKSRLASFREQLRIRRLDPAE